MEVRLTVADTKLPKISRGSDLQMKYAVMKVEPEVIANSKGTAVNRVPISTKPETCLM